MGDNKKNIEEAIKKLNQRIPINGNECKAFGYYFQNIKYLGHLRYGLENSLISVEKLVLNIPITNIDQPAIITSFISFSGTPFGYL